MRILISAFEAFGKHSSNVTQQLLELLPDRILNDKGREHILFKKVLPVEYSRSFDILNSYVQDIAPDCIIACGLAAGRDKISIERIAININHAQAADNAKVILKDKLIKTDGHSSYFSTLQYPDEVYKLSDVVNSYSAGTYVCNDLLYRLLYCVYEKNAYTKHKENIDDNMFPVSFIHFPSKEKLDIDKQLDTFVNILKSL